MVLRVFDKSRAAMYPGRFYKRVHAKFEYSRLLCYYNRIYL